MERVILKGQTLRHEPNGLARHARAAAEGREPEVRLVEVDGTLRALEIRCSCGETTTIELATQEPETGAVGGNPQERQAHHDGGES